MPQRMRVWRSFGQKLSNDWVLNLSALLAFNLLMATFPLLLLVLALVGITFGLLSPELEQQVIHTISAVFPPTTGQTVVATAAENLKRSAGFLLALGLFSALFLGSRLFVVIENCFGIIYRVRSRDLARQNLVAIGMVLLFIVLVPLFLLLSVVPDAVLAILRTAGHKVGFSVAMQVLVFVGTIGVAMIIFGLIYWIVPNRPALWRSTWPGMIVAAVLLVLYEKLFPWYVGTFLRPDSYGSIAGFALVILIFYDYLALILLLGAEINSWVSGKRETAGDLQAILTEVDKQATALQDVVPAAVHPPEKLDVDNDRHADGAGKQGRRTGPRRGNAARRENAGFND